MNELCLFTNLTSPEWAAWVQALLSGVAIVVAVFLPWIQHRRDLKAEASRRKDEKNERVRIVEMIMMHAAVATQNAADVLLNATVVDEKLALEVKVHRDIVAESNDMVSGIPFHELPSAAVLRSAFHLSGTSTTMGDYLSRLKTSLESGTFDLTDAKRMAQLQKTQSTQRLEALRRVVNEFCNPQLAVDAAASGKQ